MKSLEELNLTIRKIRQNTSLQKILDSILHEAINFTNSEAGIIFITDENQRLISYAIEEISFNRKYYKSKKHPADIFVEKCSLTKGNIDDFFENNLDRVGDNSIYKEFLRPIPKAAIAVTILNVKNKPIGSLSLFSYESDRYSQVCMNYIKNICEQISSTIQKVLEIDKLEKIKKINDVLFHDYDPKKLVVAISQIYNAYGCSIFLRDGLGEKIKYRLWATTGIKYFNEEMHSDVFYYEDESEKYITPYIGKNRKAIRIVDLKDLDDLASIAPKLKRTGYKFAEIKNKKNGALESYLGCPLSYNSEVIGVIRLCKNDDWKHFSPYDEESLKIISYTISARISLEEKNVQLRASQDLEFLTGQIFNFAHDARNTVTTVDDYWPYITEDLIPRNVMQNKANFQIVNEMTKLLKLTKLYINKLANYSKLNRPINPKPVKLKKIINELSEMFSEKLFSNKIEFRKLIDNKLIIDFDPERLQQIFLNLLLNSITMIGRNNNGVIAIKARIVEENSISYAEIEFKDNGSGVQPDDRDRIFERGYSTTGGTGLGLSIAKSYIEQHNGTIFLARNTKKNIGALFVIKVPTIYVRE